MKEEYHFFMQGYLDKYQPSHDTINLQYKMMDSNLKPLVYIKRSAILHLFTVCRRNTHINGTVCTTNLENPTWGDSCVGIEEHIWTGHQDELQWVTGTLLCIWEWFRSRDWLPKTCSASSGMGRPLTTCPQTMMLILQELYSRLALQAIYITGMF